MSSSADRFGAHGPCQVCRRRPASPAPVPWLYRLVEGIWLPLTPWLWTTGPQARKGALHHACPSCFATFRLYSWLKLGAIVVALISVGGWTLVRYQFRMELFGFVLHL